MSTIRSKRGAEFWSREARNDHFTFEEYLDFLDHGEWDWIEASRNDRIYWEHSSSCIYNQYEDLATHDEDLDVHFDCITLRDESDDYRPGQAFHNCAATFGDDDFPDDPVNEEPWRLPKKCGN